MKSTHLRNGILIFAVVLIAVIAVFFFHARWLARRLSHDLPSELAKTIQQSTQGFTHSESRGGHTIYTLHASKAVQFKSDGHAELHDVSITLFNAQGAPANRIYGRAFDWDPVHGIARALGEVQIDFEGNASPNPPAEKDAVDGGEGKSTIHVKTSGVIFNKQTGLASTEQKIEFRLAAAAGSALGASFNSQTGVMILASQVMFNSSIGGSPLSVRAQHAQFDRESRLMYLLQDVIDFEDNHSSSNQATVSFRPDGSASQVESEGNVVLTGSNGQTIKTRRAHVDLGSKSEPLQAKADGGLLYAANANGRQLHGSSSSGTILIGPQMTLRHVQMQDAVSLVDVETFPTPQGRPAKAKMSPPVSSSRQIQATRIDVDFSSGPDRTPEARRIVAAGGARMNVHTIYRDTPPQDTTVKGDTLEATLVDGESLSRLQGNGHTTLTEVTPNSVKQNTTGDTLLLTFASAGGSSARQANPEAASRLQSALQQGHVTLRQETPPATAGAKPGAPSMPVVTTAAADRAAYDAVRQVVQLSGSPRIGNSSGELSAEAIEMDRTTGNAKASGGVKATYRQASGQPDVAFSGGGAVHVVADHARLEHATELATFFGKPGVAARLWQASNAVSAPVLELSRAKATLAAHGSEGESTAVTAILTSEPSNAGEHAGSPGHTGAAAMVRVQSRTLFYSENGRKAVFTGNVVAQTSTGTLRAGAMDIYFVAASGPRPPKGAPDQEGSKVERIVALDGVELVQPGRKGTGQELTYTAADSQFLLTGTSTAPPRLSDQVRGTVTGTSLIFNDRDDSVTVSGGRGRAVTQTRVAR